MKYSRLNPEPPPQPAESGGVSDASSQPLHPKQFGAAVDALKGAGAAVEGSSLAALLI